MLTDEYTLLCSFANADMKIHFLGSKKPLAQRAVQQLMDRYGQNDIADAAYIVAVGGDGTTLRALQLARSLTRVPVFAMRLPDSVGALGNLFDISNLDKRLEMAQGFSIKPLRAEATLVSGSLITCFGINEIVVSREKLQAAKLLVAVDKSRHNRSLTGDGLLIATPIGSTGYNEAIGGPTLPWNLPLLALTGIAVRQPLDWRSLVLDDRVVVEVEVIDPQYRPVRIESNAQEFRQINRVQISCEHDAPLTLLVERH